MTRTRTRTWRMLLLIAMVAAMVVAPITVDAQTIQQIHSRIGGTAGETLAEGDVVAIKSADGKVWKADADDSTLRPAIGIIGKGGAADVGVEVVTRGVLGGLSSLTKGGPVYLSTTAGARTQSQPAAYGQILGVAISATEMTIAVGSPNNTLADATVATAKLAANAVTSAKASTNLVTKTISIEVENLAAGVDIGDGTGANARGVWRAPTALTLSAAKIVGYAASAGIDATNTAVVKLYRATNAIVTKTYNNVTTWPAAATFDDLGTLDVTEKVFAAGDVLKFDIVNGTTADPPAFRIQVDYTTTE